MVKKKGFAHYHFEGWIEAYQYRDKGQQKIVKVLLGDLRPHGSKDVLKYPPVSS